jgi:peptide/nickel transport system permease protein
MAVFIKRTACRVLKVVGMRVAGMLGILLAASFAISAAVYAAPGSPLDAIAGNRTLDPVTRASLERQYGVDQSFLEQYWNWISGLLLHGDLGTSMINGSPVSELVGDRAATSFLLVVMATVMTVGAGVIVGAAGALKGGRTDAALGVVSTGLLGVPPFVAGTVLLWVFSVQLRWFPTHGSGAGLWDLIWHSALPSVALALTLLAFTSRVTRSALIEERDRPHVETAHARGFSPSYVFRRHVFRNALIPVVTVGGLTLAGMLGAAVVVEQVFQLDGIGSLLIVSVGRNDLPVVQAVGLIIVIVFVVVNATVDVLYSILDPRVRRSSR